jgi:hypothetical protein
VLKNSAGAQLQAWHITAPSRAPSITLCWQRITSFRCETRWSKGSESHQSIF